MHWKVEIMFSAVKRKVGESVRSKRPDLAQNEAGRMFIHFSKLKVAAL